MKKHMDKKEWWFTTVEVAKILGVTRDTVVQHIRRGTLKASRPGFLGVGNRSHGQSGRLQYYVKGADLDEWLKSSRKAYG